MILQRKIRGRKLSKNNFIKNIRYIEILEKEKKSRGKVKNIVYFFVEKNDKN